MIHHLLSQAARKIKDASRIFVFLPNHPREDVALAGNALQLFLKNMNKEVFLIVPEFHWPRRLHFLPQPKTISTFPQGIFEILLDISEAKPSELSYEIRENKLSIFVSLEDGVIQTENISFPKKNKTADLFITIGVEELVKLEKFYTNHVQIFSETPIINIDRAVENDGFGQISLVDVTSHSLCEILYLLMKEIDSASFDTTLTTILLTGIILETHCFRLTYIRPQALQIAGELVGQKADREKIMAYVYRQRTLPVLHLWGLVLEKFQYDASSRIGWSSISNEDFQKTNTTPEILPDIIDEILANIRDLDIIILFFETKEKTLHGILSLHHCHIQPENLLPDVVFSSQDPTLFSLADEKKLEDASLKILSILKKNYLQVQERNKNLS